MSNPCQESRFQIASCYSGCPLCWQCKVQRHGEGRSEGPGDSCTQYRNVLVHQAPSRGRMLSAPALVSIPRALESRSPQRCNMLQNMGPCNDARPLNLQSCNMLQLPSRGICLRLLRALIKNWASQATREGRCKPHSFRCWHPTVELVLLWFLATLSLTCNVVDKRVPYQS